MIRLRRHSVRAGFTLVELLVAIAVLSIIVVAVGQIVGTASSITTLNNKHTDANTQARTVFDRMANDFARMVKRNDVDFIFCKNSSTGTQGKNDTMYFFTEGASYYNGTQPTTYTYKNTVSVVGYRINDGSNGMATFPTPPYGQMERLGKALMWDPGSSSYPAVAFLTYPAAGGTPTDTATGINYSSADDISTLWGAYVNSSDTSGSAGKSLVGTGGAAGNYFNDGDDTSYHTIGSNVFRFEISFQLKDGTQSVIPVMQQSNTQFPAVANGVPFSLVTATKPPTYQDDSQNNGSDGTFAINSRWYDTADQIGYICIDATPNYAIWHEIGVQDIAAVVVTIAVIDNQGLYFINNNNIDPVANLSLQFEDCPAPTAGTPDVATALFNSWTSAVTPATAGAKSAVSTATKIPQSMVSQIRIYQRFFYINKT